MLFSFLIPVYNTKKYLQKCMESILCQEGAEFEIVLIDDGSTDGSAEMCDKYAEEYPEIVRVLHKQNEGLLLTRRRGFKEASGDWFICVDSDDYISSQLLTNVVRIIQDYDCDMVMYNYSYCNDRGDISRSRLSFEDISIFEGDSKQIILEKRLLTSDVNTMWMRATRRDVVDIDNDYSDCGVRNMCEDAVQNLALYTNAKRIVYTSRSLYYYRKGEESITAKINTEYWTSIKRSVELTEQYLEKWVVSDRIKNSFYTQNCETYVNFVRWLAQACNKIDIETLERVYNSPNIQISIQVFNNCYSSTKYNRLCVPLVMSLIKRKKYVSLKYFFKLEKIIRKAFNK